MFEEVNIEAWPRKLTYEFFKDFEDPFFNITANLDVDRLYKFSKQNDLSFSLAILFYSLQTVNGIREFRFRLKDGIVVEFDAIHATQTIINDDETFSFCYFESKPSVFEFDKAGRAAQKKYRVLKTFDVESGRLDLIYSSVIPWISFTSFKHASRLDRFQTIPRVVFGKMFDESGARKMPVSVEVHHAMMDGIHVGKFFNRLQEAIDLL
ncbi:MAG: chloramphenicol acetyltransferase [Saprospiraceae bacterium]|nr:chloramphenicol acetyltransferase [Pyrinomonadaceae bacterium]